MKKKPTLDDRFAYAAGSTTIPNIIGSEKSVTLEKTKRRSRSIKYGEQRLENNSRDDRHRRRHMHYRDHSNHRDTSDELHPNDVTKFVNDDIIKANAKSENNRRANPMNDGRRSSENENRMNKTLIRKNTVVPEPSCCEKNEGDGNKGVRHLRHRSEERQKSKDVEHVSTHYTRSISPPKTKASPPRARASNSPTEMSTETNNYYIHRDKRSGNNQSDTKHRQSSSISPHDQAVPTSVYGSKVNPSNYEAGGDPHSEITNSKRHAHFSSRYREEKQSPCISSPPSAEFLPQQLHRQHRNSSHRETQHADCKKNDCSPSNHKNSRTKEPSPLPPLPRKPSVKRDESDSLYVKKHNAKNTQFYSADRTESTTCSSVTRTVVQPPSNSRRQSSPESQTLKQQNKASCKDFKSSCSCGSAKSSKDAQLIRSRTYKFVNGLDILQWEEEQAKHRQAYGNFGSYDRGAATFTDTTTDYTQNVSVDHNRHVDEVMKLDRQIQSMRWKVTLLILIVILLSLAAGIIACFTHAWWFGVAQIGVAIAAVLSGIAFSILLEQPLQAHKLIIPVIAVFEIFLLCGIIAEHTWKLPLLELVAIICAFVAIFFYCCFAFFASSAAAVISKRRTIMHEHETSHHIQTSRNADVLNNRESNNTAYIHPSSSNCDNELLDNPV